MIQAARRRSHPRLHDTRQLFHRSSLGSCHLKHHYPTAAEECFEQQITHDTTYYPRTIERQQVRDIFRFKQD
jgi:hypothetical protein